MKRCKERFLPAAEAAWHLVGFEALEVLATHDMGHCRMKLCCADVAIVLFEMRTRMEWA